MSNLIKFREHCDSIIYQLSNLSIFKPICAVGLSNKGFVRNGLLSKLCILYLLFLHKFFVFVCNLPPVAKESKHGNSIRGRHLTAGEKRFCSTVFKSEYAQQFYHPRPPKKQTNNQKHNNIVTIIKSWTIFISLLLFFPRNRIRLLLKLLYFCKLVSFITLIIYSLVFFSMLQGNQSNTLTSLVWG